MPASASPNTPTVRPLTMSSQEIASQSGKAHSHVMRDIRKMFKDLGLATDEGQSKFGSAYTDEQGKRRKCFELPFREFSILVTGYSVQLRADLFDAWHKLESERRTQPAVTIQSLLDNPPQLLALAQGFALQVEDLKRDKAVMQQDVDVVERLGRADDTFGVRVVASMLGMEQNKLVRWLLENGWAYRQNGSRRLMGYANKRKVGYLKHRPFEFTRSDGEPGVREDLVFYMAGVIKLARMLNVEIKYQQGDLLAAAGIAN